MSDSVRPHRRQAPPSLGFSRQEHWSGLPFPSPMQESEKWKWSRSVMSDSLRPHGLQPNRLLCPWDFPGKSTGVGCRWYKQKVKCYKIYKKWDIDKYDTKDFKCRGEIEVRLIFWLCLWVGIMIVNEIKTLFVNLEDPFFPIGEGWSD